MVNNFFGVDRASDGEMEMIVPLNCVYCRLFFQSNR
jgi:hypothetical protein